MLKRSGLFCSILLSLLLARKVYLVINYFQQPPVTYWPQISLSNLDQDVDFERVIDQNVSVISMPKLAEKTCHIFVIVLTAPNNFLKRQLTRNELEKVVKKSINLHIQWAFVIGQTQNSAVEVREQGALSQKR